MTSDSNGLLTQHKLTPYPILTHLLNSFQTYAAAQEKKKIDAQATNEQQTRPPSPKPGQSAVFLTPRLFPEDDDSSHNGETAEKADATETEKESQPPTKKRKRVVPPRSWPVDTLDVNDNNSSDGSQAPSMERKRKKAKGKSDQVDLTTNMMESMSTMTNSISVLAGAYQKSTTEISPNAKWASVLADKIDEMPKHLQEKFKHDVDNMAYEILSGISSD